MDVDKSFRNWRAQEVEENFGIRRTRESAVLDRWINGSVEVPEEQWRQVERLRQTAQDHIDTWNEHVLKFLFIGPLLALVDFLTNDYSAFMEQTLVVSNDKATARGNVDFMVATGTEIPRTPFYLLHEYKPETTAVLDPKGQLLIAMVAAQKANEAEGIVQPVYGAYVLGRLWFLVVLNDKDYTISPSFDCTKKDDIRTIFQSLHVVKQYIDNLFLKYAEQLRP